MFISKKITAVLLAAGSSTRMGENKMLLRFCDKNPIELCLTAFSGIADEAVIAVSDSTRSIAENAAMHSPFPVKLVRGGSTRQESVHSAVSAADGDIVSIHDCARCLVDANTIKASIYSAIEYGCGIASVHVVDTIRDVRTGEIIDRNNLIAAQTPQSFDRILLLEAYSRAQGNFTDDAALFRAAGNSLYYTSGNSINRKLTTADDIELFEAVIRGRMK